MATSTWSSTVRDWEIHTSTPSLPEKIIPISFTSYRYFSECPLRFGFSIDGRFQQKINPKARMGSAFHAAITKAYQPDASLITIMEYFQNEIRRQRNESMANYRERNLPWPKDLRELMENTLAVIFAGRGSNKGSPIRSHVETTLVSKDKLLIGRPDTVLITQEGTIIIDYKTGHFDQESVSDYEDQILFYSGLWQENQGDYPILGRVVFILDGHSHNFPINKKQCTSLLAGARQVVAQISNMKSKLGANTGVHCAMCDYRPWCDTYWSINKQAQDFQGIICGKHPRDSQSFCLYDEKSHRTIVNRSMVPIPDWESGTKVRVLDSINTGSVYIKGIYSELFKILN